MYDGRVVQIGTPQELFERPAHTFVGYFIGSPGMNLFDAQISGNAAQVAGTSIDLTKSYAPKGGKTQLGVRPEFIRLNGEGLGLPAKVTRVEDVGRHKSIRLDVAGQPVRAIAEEGATLPSAHTPLRFPPAGLKVYADGCGLSAEGDGE